MPRLPKKLGSLIDLAYRARSERIEYQREAEAAVEKLKQQESAVHAAIIEELRRQGLSGSKGGEASATLVDKVIPQPDLENGGWPSIWAWAKANDAFDIFERRLAKLAVRDRLDAGQKIPGVKVTRLQELSINKLGEK